MIPIKLQNATAYFGKLDNRSLNLSDGLNVIYAPNESGKSTWTQFLRCMIFGLSTKERGASADKNKYLPWSGASMEGQITFQDNETEYTLERVTARANAPMGSFHLYYKGTANEVPGITSENFADHFIGVSREVFERSALIGQNSISVTQDSSLEQRITSLMTTGDESISFSKSYDTLKNLLNKRKHNQYGTIPTIQSEIAELAETSEKLTSLIAQADSAKEMVERCSKAQNYLNEQWELQKASEKRAIAQQYQQASEKETQLKEKLQTMQETSGPVPDVDALLYLNKKLSSVESLQASVEEAKDITEQCIDNATLLKDKWDHTKTLRKFKQTPKLVFIAFLVSILLFAGFFATRNYFALCGGILCILASVILYLIYNRKSKSALKQTEQMAYDALDEAKQKASVFYSLQTRFSSEFQDLMEHLSPYSDSNNLADIQQALDAFQKQLDAFHEITQQLQQCSFEVGILKKQLPENYQTILSSPAPEYPRDQLISMQTTAKEALREAQAKFDFILGQIRSAGNAEDIACQIRQKESELQQYSDEFDALTLAMDVLSQSNTEISNRFSPALSARACKIFSDLTGNRYDQVFMNRDFSISVRLKDEIALHDVQQLSQGAYDQLYFAVRMAICQMLLPEEKHLPIILDDTFISYDDQRLEKALDYLVNEGKHRQILLFTCQRRECEYLKSKFGISYQELA